MLDIEELVAIIDGRTLLKGVNLRISPGEIHAIMGPNGAGKSTLAKVLAGHPDYETAGKVLFEGTDILELEPEERAHLGLFMGFQYPVEIPGIANAQFLLSAYNASRQARGEEILTSEAFKEILETKMAHLGMKADFSSRNVNEGFSGGEKKRNEILQMAVLEPKFAILDETDSGLDIDALKSVAEGIKLLRRPDNALLLITHYQRLLDYICPDYVHVLVDGRIVTTGGADLALKLEAEGYEQWQQ
jgi:Fe-S cluster assembly ATP-binding protein